MNVYLLRESSEYPDCYFVQAYTSRDEAIRHIEPYFQYRFIEGNELKLSLQESESTNE